MLRFIVICMLIFLMGCGNYDTSDFRDVVKVTGVVAINGSSWCKYQTNSDNSYFIDTCGKFQVGDTLKVVKK